MALYKVTYDRWFRDREQNWDYENEEEWVYATSADHAIKMVSSGMVKVNHVVAREATADEVKRYIKNNVD